MQCPIGNPPTKLLPYLEQVSIETGAITMRIIASIANVTFNPSRGLLQAQVYCEQLINEKCNIYYFLFYLTL